MAADDIGLRALCVYSFTQCCEGLADAIAERLDMLPKAAYRYFISKFSTMAKDTFTVGVDYELLEKGGEYFWVGLGEYEQAKAGSRRGFGTEGLAVADAESSLRCFEELKEAELSSESAVSVWQ